MQQAIKYKQSKKKIIKWRIFSLTLSRIILSFDGNSVSRKKEDLLE